MHLNNKKKNTINISINKKLSKEYIFFNILLLLCYYYLLSLLIPSIILWSDFIYFRIHYFIGYNTIISSATNKSNLPDYYSYSYFSFVLIIVFKFSLFPFLIFFIFFISPFSFFFSFFLSLYYNIWYPFCLFQHVQHGVIAFTPSITSNGISIQKDTNGIISFPRLCKQNAIIGMPTMK